MKNILMCPPLQYDIEYEINPWMHTDVKVDKQEVMEEYRQVKSLYEKLGATVYEIEQVKGLPDMVYTANFGTVWNKKFIKANFKHTQRRAESAHAQAYMRQQFGFQTVELPISVYFEGQGDLLTDGTRTFFGWGKRSSREAVGYLEKYIDQPVIDFETINPYFYHLDTCFAPLTPDLAVINPQSFKPADLEKIHSHFRTVIEAGDEDNAVLACNMVQIDKNIVVGEGITPEFRSTLESHGYTVHEIDTTEYIKGGGSIKCISLEF